MNAILRRSRKPCMAPRLFRVLAIALLLTLGPASNLSAANPPAFVRVLSDADEAVYRDMFAAAAAGDREKVLALSSQVKDKSLLGHVAAKGFLSPKTVAGFDELKSWLKAHSDYPEAARIHLLATRKDPSRARELKDPPRRIIRGAGDDDADSNVGFTSPQAEAISKKLRGLIAARKMQDAAKYLESAEMRTQLSKADYGRLTHQIAAGQYYLGDSTSALLIADNVAERVRDEVPEADWIAGLAAFRLGKYELATKHFIAMADNPASTSWLRSAAGFWAARSALIARQPEHVARMLDIASQKPRTFYGLLALHTLGREAPFSWDEPDLDKSSFQRLVKVNGIARGVGLYQVGEMEPAEGSIARAHGRLNPELDRAFIALAHDLGFAHIQLLGAHAARDPALKAAAYPIMSVKPSDGWQVDPALVHAIVRQESKFEMRVTSSADARGLMQLMPATAAGTMKDTTLDNPGAKAKLFDPAFNLSVGQRYVQKMMSFVEPDGDLLKLLVSYNGGPGNLQKWFREVDHKNDPLLFIESLPSRETRGYVERVVANYWIYQDRLGEKKTTLDQLARGEWPVVKWNPRERVAMLSR
jgi:soluble lytic murein transglycosylase